MKKLLLTLCLMGCMSLSAQNIFSFGLRGGLNFGSNGDLTITDVQNVIEQGSDANLGFHLGFYTNIKLFRFYLRPELVYTQTSSEFEDIDYDIQKIDLPVLLGFKLIGPLSVFAGPSFQFIIDNDLELNNINLGDVENDVTVGLNIGLGLQLGIIGLDARFERGFSENEAAFIGNNINEGLAGRVDSRPSQFILSVRVRL